MIVLSYDVESLHKNTIIPLGRAHESGVTRVEINAGNWLERFPGGKLALYVKTSGGVVYPVDISVSNGVAVWLVLDSDTTDTGYGGVEVALLGADGERKLSAIAQTFVSTSLLSGTLEEPPTPLKPWVDQINEAKEEAQEAAQTAQEAAAAIPAGGYAEQVLAKQSDADFDYKWVTQTGSSGGTAFVAGDGIKLENGVLSVETANDVEEDNTLPVTSAAVFAEVGNINALLATI